MKKCAVLFLTFTALYCSAGTIWRDRNIYSVSDSIRNGDTIVIAINDVSRIKFGLNMKSKSNSDVTSTPDVTLTGFLPKIVSNRKSDNNDTFAVDSRNNLNFNIAAVVTGTQGRSFIVQGSKEYIINGVSTRFNVSGLVDPSLMSGTVVRADNVVNFRLDIASTKRGIGMNLTRPPLKPEEQANANLVEAEKQRLIIDYLNRMIEELTRK